MDLKLRIKTLENEFSIHPTYTSLTSAHFGYKIEIFKNEQVSIGVLLSEKIIGSIKILTNHISYNEENYFIQEYEIYPESCKINYLVLTIVFASNFENLSLVKFVRDTHSILENKGEDTLINVEANGFINNFSIFGVLFITTVKIFFSMNSFLSGESFVIYLACIRSMKLLPKSLLVFTKDFRTLEVFADNIKLIHDILLERIKAPLIIAQQYFTALNLDPISYNLNSSEYIITKEFDRMKGESLRVSLLNINYQLCETYPSLLYFPACISDAVIQKVAEFRSRERVPAIT